MPGAPLTAGASRCATLPCMTLQDPPARADLPAAVRWDIEAIYATPDAWEDDARTFPEALGTLRAFAGRLGTDAATITDCP